MFERGVASSKDDMAMRTLASRFRADVMFCILPTIFRPWSKLAVMNVNRSWHVTMPLPFVSWA